MFSAVLMADTSQWTGGADPNGLWSAAGNWDSAPVSGDDLLFSGFTNLFTENDLDSATGGTFAIAGITFDASADFFELDGNAIDFDGKTITNNSANEQAIFLQIQETGSGFTIDGPGDFYFDDINTSGFGRTLTKSGDGLTEIGNTNDSWSLVMNGGTLIWGSNILFGVQEINGGTLEGAAGDILHGSATVRLNNTTGTSVLKVAGAVETNFAVLEGVSGSIVSNLGITGETSTVGLNGTGDSREFAGSIQDGEDGGTTALRLAGGTAHTLVLSGANTYSGNTTVEAGATLELASTGSMSFVLQSDGSSNMIVGGGTVVLDGTVNVDVSQLGSPLVGDKWSFAQAAVTYGPNFAIGAPFAESSPGSGVWVYNDGTDNFFFSELSGTSSYGVPPELIWDGGGADELWSNADNWNGPPTDGAFTVFDGTTRLTNMNDLDTNYIAADTGLGTPEDPASIQLSGILFQPGAGAFVLQGNGIDFAGRTITNRSTETQTFELPIQADSNIGGFTVDAAVGDVVLGGTNLRNGFNDPFVKTGPGKLSVVGPKTGADTFAGEVQEGHFFADPGGNLFFHSTVAAGATLEVGTTAPMGVIHNGGNLTLNGTLVLGEGIIEDVGDLGGSGEVTNSGAEGTVSTIRLRTGRGTNFSGVIRDGDSGGATALEVGLPGHSATATFTLSGANTYTGNTAFPAAGTKLVLAEVGSLRFKLGADGVNNQVTAAAPQTTGSATFNGTFVIDISEADAVEGNGWVIVNTDNLNAAFGATFGLIADDGVTQTAFTETSADSGIWTYNDGVTNYSFSEASGEVTYGRTPVTFWTGAGGDANWSTAANWDREPLSGDQFSFEGTTGLTNTNDLDTTGSFDLERIAFGPDAGAFLLQGNAIAYSGRTLVNNSTSTQTLDLGLVIDDTIGGLTVNTAPGDVVLNSLTLENGSNTDLVKDGSGTLFVNGPLGSANAFEAVINSGSVVVSQSAPSGDSVFQDVMISSGATLRTEGDAALGAIDSQGVVTNNGTLDLAGGVTEDIGSLSGSGRVTNHAGSGGGSVLRVRGVGMTDFSGSIRDGASGGTTSLEVGIAGEADAGSLTLSGTNLYTGNTTLNQSEVSFALAESGVMSFRVGANGVNNRISAAVPQATGTTAIDGAFILDLSAANLANGNSWSLVDVANLNATFGETGFSVVNKAFVPATSYAVTSGGGAGGIFEDAAAYATGGSTETFGSSITIPAELVNPAPESVYTTSLIRAHSYTFSGLGAGAAYTVRFHAAELWGGTGAGGRVSDIYINGELAYDNHDPFALGGGTNVASIVEVAANASLSGTLFIEIRPDAASSDQNCRMNAVEVIPVPGGSSANFSQSADVWTMTEGGNTWAFSELTGVLTLTSGGGGSSYTTWAATNGIAGEPAGGDFDKDGLSNFLEYALAGLDPASPDGAPGTFDGSTLSFDKRPEAVANGDVTYSIETSTDAGAPVPWQAVTPDVNNASVISYTFPFAEPRDFARLNVE